MSPLPVKPDERSRKNLQAILQALASVGQARVAEVLETSESTVSRMKDGEFERIAKVVGALGLKVVPADVRTYDPHFVEAIFQLAKQRMAGIESASELSQD